MRLQAQQLRKTYGVKCTLKDVSFEVNAGEVLGYLSLLSEVFSIRGRLGPSASHIQGRFPPFWFVGRTLWRSQPEAACKLDDGIVTGPAITVPVVSSDVSW